MNSTNKSYDKGLFEASESIKALKESNPERYEAIAWIEALAENDKELFEAIMSHFSVAATPPKTAPVVPQEGASFIPNKSRRFSLETLPPTVANAVNLFDYDGNGKVTLDEVRQGAEELKASRKTNKMLTRITYGSILVYLLLTLSVFGVSIGVAWLTKQTDVDPVSGFATAVHRNGDNNRALVMKTGEALVVKDVGIDYSLHSMPIEELALSKKIVFNNGTVSMDIRGYSRKEHETRVLVEGGSMIFNDIGLKEMSGETPLLLLDSDSTGGENEEHRTLQDNDVADVIIIGAGWSGLAAANRLRDLGVTNVKILEARDYIGGRSRTIDGYFVEGYPVEMGSAWIYRNTEIDRLYKNKLGLPWDPSTFSFAGTTLFDDSGEMSSSKARQKKKDYMNSFVRYAQRNANPNIDFEDLLQSYFDSQPNLSNTKRQAINAFLTPLTTDLGSEFDEQDAESMNWLIQYYQSSLFQEEVIDFVGVRGGGYFKLLEDYATPIEDKIQLQAVVDTIDYGNDLVQVTTTDGEIYRAKAVISTLPIGVLQHRDVQFLPDLSSQKWDAIDSFGVGTVNKCIMYWNSTMDLSWWPEDKYELQLITPDDSDSDDWTYMLNDQAHPSNHDYHVLTAWSAGESVEKMEGEDDATTLERVMGNLRRMFGASVPEPTKILVTRWESDPYSRGVHTFRKTGEPSLYRSKQKLRQSVSNKLFFAGAVVDTTYEALNSGTSVANEVAYQLCKRCNLATQVVAAPY